MRYITAWRFLWQGLPLVANLITFYADEDFILLSASLPIPRCLKLTNANAEWCGWWWKMKRLYSNMNAIVVVSYIIPYMFSSCSAGLYYCCKSFHILQTFSLKFVFINFTSPSLRLGNKTKWTTDPLPRRLDAGVWRWKRSQKDESFSLLGNWWKSFLPHFSLMIPDWLENEEEGEPARCSATHDSSECGFNISLMYHFLQGNSSSESIWSTSASF